MGSTVCQKPFKIQMFPASMTIFITYIRTRKKKICESAPLALTGNKQTHTHTCTAVENSSAELRLHLTSTHKVPVWRYLCLTALLCVVRLQTEIHADRIPDQHWNVHIDTGQHLSNIGGLSVRRIPPLQLAYIQAVTCCARAHTHRTRTSEECEYKWRVI